MNKTFFRIVLNGFLKHIQMPAFIKYVQEEYHITEYNLKRLLTNGSGVIYEFDRKKEAELHASNIIKLGGNAEIEKVVSDISLPFSLPATENKKIKKEFSKILRTMSQLSLFLINMDSETLWAGLGQLSVMNQKDFLSSLPFNSPLVPDDKRPAGPRQEQGGC